MKLTQEQSKVEVKGAEAKFYDLLMNIITLGTYPFFIRKVIKDLGLTKVEKVIDFGAGTGRNACLMLKYLGENGKITGLDIGEEMIEKFKKNCNGKNAAIIKKRIDEPLNFEDDFDLAFISFVLHGFIQEKREIIIKNGYNVLKKGGRFAILDYNEFDVEQSSLFVKFAIRKVECPLAEDFIKRDWKTILTGIGFKDFKEKFYYKNKVRLLIAIK